MIEMLAHPRVFQSTIFVGITLLLLPLLEFLLRRFDPRLRNRLRDFDDDEATVERPMLYGPLSSVLMRPYSVPALAAFFVPSDARERSHIQSQLLQGGIHHLNAVTIYFTARLLGFFLPPVLGAALWLSGWTKFETSVLSGLGLGLIGMVIPGLWLAGRIVRRQHVLRQSLSDFLDLFVSCVESGMTLPGMIGTVADELRTTHAELASEFTICHRQLQLGHSLEASVADLAERTGLDDLRSFSTFVQQSSRFGATIGEALRELSDRLRWQREIRAEETAQKAAVKILVPTLLFIFPAVFVVLAAPAAIRIQESLSPTNSVQANAEP